MTFQNKRFVAIMAAAAIILMVPFIAMQFSDDVNWSFFDFAVAGVLLFGTGMMIEGVLRTVKNKDFRVALCLLVVAGLLLLWAELAVGIFGSPLAGS